MEDFGWLLWLFVAGLLVAAGIWLVLNIVRSIVEGVLEILSSPMFYMYTLSGLCVLLAMGWLGLAFWPWGILPVVLLVLVFRWFFPDSFWL